MFQLAAFAQNVGPTASLAPITAVSDDTVFVSGEDMRVPSALPFLIAEAACIGSDPLAEAQIQAPSLRQVANINVHPVAISPTFTDPEQINVHPESPIPLRADEAVNFAIAVPAAIPEIQYGLVWFGDGPQQRVSGNIYSVRVTSAITMVENAWVNGPIAFAQDLPVGTYDLVGMQCFGPGLTAARVNFIGGAWRPGVPAGVLPSHNVGRHFRYGKMGVFGKFHTNTPPTIDALGAGAFTQTYILDLLYRG